MACLLLAQGGLEPGLEPTTRQTVVLNVVSARSTADQPSADARSSTLLCVTPDAALVALVTMFFGSAATIDSAARLSTALRMAHRQPPDIALVDLQHADLDPSLFLTSFRHVVPDCRVILLAGGDLPPSANLAELPIAGVVAAPARVETVLASVAAVLPPPSLANDLTLRMSASLSAALEFFRANYRRRITVTDVAVAAGRSSSYVAQVFREQTGLSLRKALARLRVEVAKFLLRHSESRLKTVAAESGFANVSHLSRVFNRYVGCRPTTYRRQQRHAAAAPPATRAP